MAIIVQKFGGTSLSTVDLIKKAALRVKVEADAGHQVVVVLSAMAGMTDRFVGLVRELSAAYDRSEYDTVVSAGEQVSVGLMAVALKNIGLSARSWLGWQIPIRTSDIHSSAKIEDISIDKLQESLNQSEIAVVAGFQGISPQGRITTLGRGGSDTTAVALAAALQAERCDIYTDVEGVYTADPRFVAKAGKLDQIAYDEMLELASQGAKVLQRDSVQLAMKHQVPLRVLSSLTTASGTLISQYSQSEGAKIRGVVQSFSECKIQLKNISQGAFERLASVLQNANITIDMPCHSLTPCSSRWDYSFTVREEDLLQTQKLLDSIKNEIKFSLVTSDLHVARISIVGPYLSENPNLVQKLFHTLAEKGIQVQDVSTSDIKISVLVNKADSEKALSALHTAYNLDVK